MRMHRSTSSVTSRLLLALVMGATLFVPNSAGAAPRLAAFKLTPVDFSAGSVIPRQFTCDGANVSPELKWSGAPSGTKSFVLIVEDPDAPGGTFTHWIVFNLPAVITGLKQGADPDARQGTNGFDHIGYGGPCPPPGPAHHYFFRLYALDTILPLANGARKSAVKRAMRGHILGEAELMARYGR